MLSGEFTAKVRTPQIQKEECPGPAEPTLLGNDCVHILSQTNCSDG